ncbi:MAG: amidohydrolase family protein [Litorilinea sp.]
MLVDSHCHAWLRWPYEPPVPDPESRALVEQLIFEMDRNGVDKAAVVCARIEHNPDDNEYVADAVKRYPDRLYQITDVDCSWWPTYHTPGADKRLIEAAESLPMKGFTHYLASDDDGSWLIGDDGMAFFRAAADRNLIASIACNPQHVWAIRKVAAAFPSMPILLHHLAGTSAHEAPPYPLLNEVLAAAQEENIYIKLSGFHYASEVRWDFPYSNTHWLIRRLYERFGPHRMCWGSDYPVVRQFMTYQHALEAFRTHCSFVPDSDKAWILGDTLYGLLEAAG